jgi:triacylglycerol esterase/lipase EstA (alpha/beta hydrolase family)
MTKCAVKYCSVAAVQADVVAHSMGGDVARTMPTLATFTGQSTYGLGPVHKLITIGTPHRGNSVGGWTSCQVRGTR